MKKFITVTRDVEVLGGKKEGTITRGTVLPVVDEEHDLRYGSCFVVWFLGRRIRVYRFECTVSSKPPANCSAAEKREPNNCPIEGDPTGIF